jgi:hypothetical protein
VSLSLAFALITAMLTADPRPRVLVVVGAEGTPEYGTAFRKWADSWQTAANHGGAAFSSIGTDPEGKGTDRDRLKAYLAGAPKTGNSPLWIVLIGHGTDDSRDARFNLRGPDFTAKELAEWLAPVKRPLAFINCASASAPFLNLLSGPNRVIITATRSGSESNFARFGQYISEAVGDPNADLDLDGQVSLLEAYLTAASRVAAYYKAQARLATEHPLLDDNGDQLGSAADWFQGVRAVKRAKDGAEVDGTRAHQWHLIPNEQERRIPAAVKQRRDELELTLVQLRDQKGKLAEDEYYARLEKVMVELARLYRDLPSAPRSR